MSGSRASMALLGWLKSVIHHSKSLIERLSRPTITATAIPSGSAAVQLVDRAFESTPPTEVSSVFPVHQQLRPYENNLLRPIDAGICAINLHCVEVGAGRIVTPDESWDEEDDEEASGSEDNDQEYSEMAEFDDDSDFEADSEDADVTTLSDMAGNEFVKLSPALHNFHLNLHYQA